MPSEAHLCLTPHILDYYYGFLGPAPRCVNVSAWSAGTYGFSVGAQLNYRQSFSATILVPGANSVAVGTAGTPTAAGWVPL